MKSLLFLYYLYIILYITNYIVSSSNDIVDGWALSIGYDDDNCQGTIMSYTAISEGNCVEIFNSTNYIFNASIYPPVVGSYLASCTANTTDVIIYQYSDSNCTNYISNITESIGCNNNNKIFSQSLSSNFKSTYLTCSFVNQLPEVLSGTYMLLNGYSDNDCQSNSKVYFEAYVENVCFSTEYGSFLFSKNSGNFQSPSLFTFLDQDCKSSKYFKSPLYTYCTDTNKFNTYYQNFTTDYYDENSILSIMLQYIVSPSRSPTMLPTTLSPTFAIGDPTPLPTKLPTAFPNTNNSLPTAKPTLSPTQENILIPGWIIASNYAGVNCTNSTIPNEIISYTGIPSGVCIINYNVSNGNYVGVSSYMFTCPNVDDEDNYVVVLTSYSDLKCKVIYGIGSTFRIDSGCSDLPDVLTGIIATFGFPEEHSTSVMCRNGPEIPTFLNNDNYVKFTGYYDELCNSNNQSFFGAILTGNCAKFKTVDYGVLSIKFVNGIKNQPNVKALLYSSDDCSGTGLPQFSNFPSCANYDNSDFSSLPKVNQLLFEGIKRAKSYTFTSYVVTSAPTFPPTLRPTEPIGTVVTFDVTNHRLNGLNSIEFYDDPYSLEVFQGSINDCLDSLGPITIDIYNPLSLTRRKLQSIFDNYVLVNYTISFNMKYTVKTYSSVNAAFKDFSNTLRNDIINLVFQNYLQSYEGDYADITSNSADVSNTFISTFYSDDDNNNNNSNSNNTFSLNATEIMFIFSLLFAIAILSWKYRKIVFKFFKIYSYSDINLIKDKESSSACTSNSISMSKI